MKLSVLLTEIEVQPKVIDFLKKKLIGKIRTVDKYPYDKNPLHYRIEKIIYDYVPVRPEPYNALTLRVVILNDNGVPIKKREIAEKWKDVKKYYASKTYVDFTQHIEADIARPFDHYLELLGMEEAFCYAEIMNG